MNDKFASGFAQDLESMIALKRALGYSENTYLERAKSFDRHCFEVYPGQQELTQAIGNHRRPSTGRQLLSGRWGNIKNL